MSQAVDHRQRTLSAPGFVKSLVLRSNSTPFIQPIGVNKVIAQQKIGLVIFCFLAAIWPTMSPAAAGVISGTIRTLHVNLQTNLAHLQLDGAPSFDGGGCVAVFTANSLDDDKFMHYVWPLLVTAKARGIAVTVSVSGCLNGYAKIFSVDVEPRLGG